MGKLGEQQPRDCFRRSIADLRAACSEQQRLHGDHRAIERVGSFVTLAVEFDVDAFSGRRTFDAFVACHA
ncbi:MAG TPA: hypothetical protein VFN86_06150 [Casimicrobiaceae bacterium]|nr:hypothetical protein [Casimicrobiaceae bacterium]